MHRTHPCLALSLALLAGVSRLIAGPIQDGEEALRKGNPALAMRYFKIAIQTDGSNEAAWSGYTRASKLAASSKGQASEAEQAANQVVGSAPVAPLAPVLADGDDAAKSAEATSGNTVEQYLRGKPIFYHEGLKNLMRGRRVKEDRLASRTYEQEKEQLTRYYVRKSGGNLAISSTLFTPKLYTYLASLRAAKGKLGAKGAEEIWLTEADRSFRLLEFYVVIKNLTYKGGINQSPKLIDIGGLKDHIFLEDDKGLRYQPYKIKGLESPSVKDWQEFSVWFAPVNRKGDPLWEHAVSELKLVLEDIRGEAKRVVFPYSKSLFRRMVQVGS